MKTINIKIEADDEASLLKEISTICGALTIRHTYYIKEQIRHLAEYGELDAGYDEVILALEKSVENVLDAADRTFNSLVMTFIHTAVDEEMSCFSDLYEHLKECSDFINDEADADMDEKAKKSIEKSIEDIAELIRGVLEEDD